MSANLNSSESSLTERLDQLHRADGSIVRRIDTAVDPGSATFQANDAAQRALVADLRERLRVASLGGSEKSRERHVSRGKLLPTRPRRRAAG